MKPDLEYTGHARDVIQERSLPEDWIRDTLSEPDRVEVGSDGNTHYIKAISKHGGRMLRVVVNERVEPNRVVTLFFDRRLGRKP